ncbi:MAG: hypothetical protein N2484_19095 [Clostridia bacterium]|nr:hypothetical protein [Clostridia bacterium]
MNRLKFFVGYLLLGSLVGVVIEVASALILRGGQISVRSMLADMQASVLIGTVAILSMFFVFIKLGKGLWVGLATNFILEGLLVLGYYLREVKMSSTEVLLHYVVVLCVAEILSSFLVIAFYKQMAICNEKLEQKKEALRKKS